MIKYLYFIVLILCISIPLIVANHRDLKLYRFWKSMLFSILLPSTIYLLWDIFASHQGHWSFNPDYILGLKLLGLPIEEYLFFLFLGFISIFTYEVIQLRVRLGEKRNDS